MTSDDMPEEIYVRPVSKKTLSAVRPESPLINTSVERKHTKYIRADIVSKYNLTKCPKCGGEADNAVPEGQNHIAYAGKMVDVEALKFKVLLSVSPGGDHTEVSGAECLMIGKTIDHLYSAGYIREPLPRIEGLRAALNNVCEPQKDVSFQCPECQKYIETHNGEWFLWCGDKAHADALIKAARAYLEASEVGHLDDINVADMEGSK